MAGQIEESETRRQRNFRIAHPTPWCVAVNVGDGRATILSANGYRVWSGINIEKANFVVGAVNHQAALALAVSQ